MRWARHTAWEHDLASARPRGRAAPIRQFAGTVTTGACVRSGISANAMRFWTTGRAYLESKSDSSIQKVFEWYGIATDAVLGARDVACSNYGRTSFTACESNGWCRRTSVQLGCKHGYLSPEIGQDRRTALPARISTVCLARRRKIAPNYP